MELLAIFLVVVVVPFVLYLVHERGRGRVWGLVSAGEATSGTGVYREARVRRWKRGAAPITVRIAAISSFFLGQMIVPGALAAIVGFVAAAGVVLSGTLGGALIVVLELSAPTGLIVAAQLLSAGNALLSRADDAADKARFAAKWAIGHNLSLLIALALFAVSLPNEAMGALPSVIYALFSIGHALVLRRAASAIDAYESEQHEHPAPVDAELQILG